MQEIYTEGWNVYGIALNRSDVFETSFSTENQILELLEFVVAHFLGYS